MTVPTSIDPVRLGRRGCRACDCCTAIKLTPGAARPAADLSPEALLAVELEGAPGTALQADLRRRCTIAPDGFVDAGGLAGSGRRLERRGVGAEPGGGFPVRPCRADATRGETTVTVVPGPGSSTRYGAGSRSCAEPGWPVPRDCTHSAVCASGRRAWRGCPPRHASATDSAAAAAAK